MNKCKIFNIQNFTTSIIINDCIYDRFQLKVIIRYYYVKIKRIVIPDFIIIFTNSYKYFLNALT